MKIEWNSAAERASIDVRQALITAPILASLDFTREFVLQCDASDVLVGCVLTKVLEEKGRS